MRRVLGGSLLGCFLLALSLGCGGSNVKDPPPDFKVQQVKPQHKKTNAQMGHEPPEKIPALPAFKGSQ